MRLASCGRAAERAYSHIYRELHETGGPSTGVAGVIVTR